LKEKKFNTEIISSTRLILNRKKSSWEKYTPKDWRKRKAQIIKTNKNQVF